MADAQSIKQIGVIARNGFIRVALITRVLLTYFIYWRLWSFGS